MSHFQLCAIKTYTNSSLLYFDIHCAPACESIALLFSCRHMQLYHYYFWAQVFAITLAATYAQGSLPSNHIHDIWLSWRSRRSLSSRDIHGGLYLLMTHVKVFTIMEHIRSSLSSRNTCGVLFHKWTLVEFSTFVEHTGSSPSWNTCGGFLITMEDKQRFIMTRDSTLCHWWFMIHCHWSAIATPCRAGSLCNCTHFWSARRLDMHVITVYYVLMMVTLISCSFLYTFFLSITTRAN